MTIQLFAASIAQTVRDYRAGEIPTITDQTVVNWVGQFDPAVQLGLLSELDHVLRQIYLSRQKCQRFLRTLLRHQPLTGGATAGFWKDTRFLDIQQNGGSQTDFLGLLDAELRALTGLDVASCGSSPKRFFYIDDVLFTGGRVGTDVGSWIANHAPQQCELHLAFMATHTLGEWQVGRRLAQIASACKKQVSIRFWQSIQLENRKSYAAASEVLWPSAVPRTPAFQQLNSAQKYPLVPRTPAANFQSIIFSGEHGRQLLENEMLDAGLRIRSFSQNPSPALKPLGFGPFGMGFGSTIVTFRNCPNNAPLALWWGDPAADSSHPFSKWTPLFPRKTYNAGGALTDFF